MSLRLVYLPDPTVKFYYDKVGKEYFVYSELYEHELESGQYIEIKVRPKRAHFNILVSLREKFNDLSYSEPYFEGLLPRVELFEILEVPDGKAPKTRT